MYRSTCYGELLALLVYLTWLLHIIPIVIYHLVFLVLPKDPMLLRILAKTLAEMSAWRLRGHPPGAHPNKIKCFKKTRKKMISGAMVRML